MIEYLPRPVGYRVDPVISRQISIAMQLRGKPMTLNELNAALIKWADDREITKHSTPYAQAFKTAEEVQELIEAVARHGEILTWCTGYEIDEAKECVLYDIRDAIGDVFITLVVGMACSPTEHREINCLAGQGASGQKDPVGSLQKNLVALSKFAPQTGGDSPRAMYYAAVGLMMGNLAKVALDFGTPLEACVEQAYDAIKDRKGRLLPNGVFVKDE